VRSQYYSNNPSTIVNIVVKREVDVIGLVVAAGAEEVVVVPADF
jgi:hypothetical protein